MKKVELLIKILKNHKILACIGLISSPSRVLPHLLVPPPILAELLKELESKP
jgi:hypothetical protein